MSYAVTYDKLLPTALRQVTSFSLKRRCNKSNNNVLNLNILPAIWPAAMTRYFWSSISEMKNISDGEYWKMGQRFTWGKYRWKIYNSTEDVLLRPNRICPRLNFTCDSFVIRGWLMQNLESSWHTFLFRSRSQIFFRLREFLENMQQCIFYFIVFGEMIKPMM